MAKERMRTGRDGIPKKMRVNIILANARPANPNEVKPLPLILKPGGVANADTSRTTHHTNVTTVSKTVMNRRRRMLQRLYGDTAGSSGVSALLESTRLGSRRVCSSGGADPPSSSSSGRG